MNGSLRQDLWIGKLVIKTQALEDQVVAWKDWINFHLGNQPKKGSFAIGKGTSWGIFLITRLLFCLLHHIVKKSLFPVAKKKSY